MKGKIKVKRLLYVFRKTFLCVLLCFYMKKVLNLIYLIKRKHSYEITPSNLTHESKIWP